MDQPTWTLQVPHRRAFLWDPSSTLRWVRLGRCDGSASGHCHMCAAWHAECISMTTDLPPMQARTSLALPPTPAPHAGAAPAWVMLRQAGMALPLGSYHGNAAPPPPSASQHLARKVPHLSLLLACLPAVAGRWRAAVWWRRCMACPWPTRTAGWRIQMPSPPRTVSRGPATAPAVPRAWQHIRMGRAGRIT